ncbi:unnamed protein product [Ambrosiozyma monospora]|uniref:Unnamed protein product n=1 Tax=Ambrosiozyma monospora TaxID=43982 RepID=A0A9W6Z908_AMBMO|nr:unnamed protein product [Ambrosiozyma monospora]
MCSAEFSSNFNREEPNANQDLEIRGFNMRIRNSLLFGMSKIGGANMEHFFGLTEDSVDSSVVEYGMTSFCWIDSLWVVALEIWSKGWARAQQADI